MANFASFAAAEVRAYAKVLDKTWIEAFACKQVASGLFAVRVIRKMAAPMTDPTTGGWVEITDDATV